MLYQLIFIIAQRFTKLSSLNASEPHEDLNAQYKEKDKDGGDFTLLTM
jgi:hypothetical protein